ncbi:flagellar basal body rod modification protein [Campylobacter upsaliensis]|uniref:flagellar basal body rod modification protein n=1 Tax=Campylobacter upsaliensis TaxID=28080 RepID=UPI00127F8D3E|nr:flagellar basal body rod modification protein [Campylobacter upsaliensis]EAH5847792.1 flagellar basal body rod modification protein [Campylobacter upsaliensis]EAJ7398112.1 flagellar basal body rod modification protein [Campylobacter upsaliensis]EAK0838714.1 flagellar basal body rod modification protein [Campylobacter upsaliensis]EAL1701892.1 flagellar basal body rod modification protein [Campylobacter upsaliensis]EGT9682028.1 flagellar basal body rod modification protein [Campylobacter upsa
MTTEWNPNLNWQNTQTKTDNTTQNNGGSLTPNNQGNPGAVLDKDAFLKLLLIEMQHQDPTDPMDSDKMLTQTSQLAALEMQQNTNNTMQQMVAQMEKLSNAMGTSQSIGALGAIGKMATIADNKIKLTGPDEVIALKMYLPEASNKDGITLEVYDKDNKLVYTEKASEGKEVSAGHFTMEWPGRNNDGVYAGDGEYTVKIVYNNQEGKKVTASYGTYPIEGVVFKEGVAYAKMAGQEVPFDALGEITDYKFSLGSNNSNNNTGGDSEKPETEKPETDNKPTDPNPKPEEKPKA